MMGFLGFSSNKNTFDAPMIDETGKISREFVGPRSFVREFGKNAGFFTFDFFRYPDRVIVPITKDMVL